MLWINSRKLVWPPKQWFLFVLFTVDGGEGMNFCEIKECFTVKTVQIWFASCMFTKSYHFLLCIIKLFSNQECRCGLIVWEKTQKLGMRILACYIAARQMKFPHQRRVVWALEIFFSQYVFVCGGEEGCFFNRVLVWYIVCVMGGRRRDK